jgi:hypothetical protein
VTPIEIADMIRRAPVLSPEFQEAAEALRAHTKARAATGAPVTLEDHLFACMIDATRAAQRAQDACNRHARLAAAAAVDMSTAHAAAGHGFGWAPRENMTGINTESPAHKIEVARLACEALRHAVDLFAELADRIVATPADMERQAQEQRTRRLNAWGAVTIKALKAAVAKHGIKLPRDASRAETNAALADAWVDP